MQRMNSRNATTLTAAVVRAYVSKNSVAAAELPGLMISVHRIWANLLGGATATGEARKPAVPVRRSVSDDFIICLEDGRKFKSLKRHLRTRYNMTPEEYRAKWRLPADYPMVAPGYTERRSRMAKDMGFGRTRGKAEGKSRPLRSQQAALSQRSDR